MYKPKFQLSTKLLSNLTTIERLYGQIESLNIPQTLELNLHSKNLVASAYASNRIEGNPLTLPEVTNLLLNDRVPTSRNEKEVTNYYGILERLDAYTKRSEDIALVTQIHRELLDGIDTTAGTIRDVKVVVGKYREEKGDVSLRVKHDPPFHTQTEIEKHIGELMRWTETTDEPVVVKAGVFHHEFVYLHPFEDGNGRVCRILTALLFLKNGYRINKYFILDDYYDIDRDQYSDMLHSADAGDKTAWLEYFSDGMKYSLQSAHARVKEALMTLRVEEQPTRREREVLHFFQERREATTQHIAQFLGVSRQQAHGLLSGLVEKGLLEKRGKTKSSYYVLK